MTHDPSSGVNAGPAASSFPPPGTDAVPDEAKPGRDPLTPIDPAAPELVLLTDGYCCPICRAKERE